MSFSPWWIVAIVAACCAIIVTVVWLVQRGQCVPRPKVAEGELLSDDTKLRHIVVSLPYRTKKYERVRKELEGFGFPCERFQATVGKRVHIEDVDNEYVAPSFQRHIRNTEKHRGHYGCTLSMMMVWRKMIEEKYEGPVAICEDDVVFPDRFDELIHDRLARLKRVGEWHIMYGGMSCSYKTYDKCHANDGMPLLEEHLYRVKHAIGMWYYVVNGWRSALRLLEGMKGMTWMIDHNISEQLFQKDDSFVALCSSPVIALHPGTFQIDSFNEEFTASADNYVSDTNI